MLEFSCNFVLKTFGTILLVMWYIKGECNYFWTSVWYIIKIAVVELEAFTCSRDFFFTTCIFRMFRWKLVLPLEDSSICYIHCWCHGEKREMKRHYPNYAIPLGHLKVHFVLLSVRHSYFSRTGRNREYISLVLTQNSSELHYVAVHGFICRNWTKLKSGLRRK
jgi:hypothetical protein